MSERIDATSRCELTCSVVVTTWRRTRSLRRTLESIQRQDYPSIEIVVVCDGPDRETEQLADSYVSHRPIRWVMQAENEGLPAARNRGAREASGDIVLFLDDDVVADPELVSMHVSHHAAASNYRKIAVHSLARNKSMLTELTPLERYLNQAWAVNLRVMAEALGKADEDSVSEEVQQYACFGLNSSIRRAEFESSGGFDERLRASDEEIEYGLRLHSAGVEIVFEPRVMLTHENEAPLTEYYPKCWRASAAIDVYRVFERGQRNVQTRKLAALTHGPWLKRATGRIAWSNAKALLAMASLLKCAADTTKLRAFGGAWARLTHEAEYWGAVKETGCPLERIRNLAGRERVALMLHSIAAPHSPEEASYYIAPERFQRLMGAFLKAGFKTAPLDQWLEDNVPPQHVLLTFDDAYDDLYEHLLPMVIEHRFNPLIFVVADRVGDSNVWDQASGLRARNLMTAGQLREMQRYGVVFGSHTLTHPWLPDVSDEQLHREVRDSKKKLEDLLGAEITSFAYPYGGVDRRVRSAVAMAGYEVAFTTRPGANWWNDPLCQRRAEVNDYTTEFEFRWKLRRGERFQSTVGRRLRELESDMPSNALRGLVGGIRRSLKAASKHFVR